MLACKGIFQKFSKIIQLFQHFLAIPDHSEIVRIEVQEQVFTPSICGPCQLVKLSFSWICSHRFQFFKRRSSVGFSSLYAFGINGTIEHDDFSRNSPPTKSQLFSKRHSHILQPLSQLPISRSHKLLPMSPS